MPKKPKPKNKKPSKKWTKYKVDDNNLVRAKTCPKCGVGVFLGEYKDRYYCGKCHYVVYKDKK